MRKKVLNVLCCPICKNTLELLGENIEEDEITEGSLECTHCHRSYQIIGGVPRMIIDLLDRKKLSESWGFEWVKKAEGKLEVDTSYGKTEEQELKFCLDSLEISAQGLQGKMVLDAGCGYGRLTRALGRHGAEVFGIDFASSIDLIHRMGKHQENVHIIQADILNPPLRNESFDYVWSNLSICFVNHPEQAFRKLSALVKPIGKIFISVPDKENPSFVVRVRQFLKITHRIPRELLLKICWALAPLLFLAKKVIRGDKTTVRENVFFLFNSFHSNLMTRHTRGEVLNWFRQEAWKHVKCACVGGAIKVTGIKG